MDLTAYRKIQHKLATMRDDGCCQYHGHIWGVHGIAADEVHHVHGRSRDVSRESHDNLICLCKFHHDLVTRNAIGYEEMRTALDMANQYPASGNYMERFIAHYADDMCDTEFAHGDGLITHSCGTKIAWYSGTGFCPTCGIIILEKGYE